MRTLFIVLLAALCNVAFSQNFFIGRITATLTDAARSNRQVPVEIFYPATAAGNNTPVGGTAGEQFPVIAFGHGFSMNYDAYSNFWNEFVPQGYILIFPKTEIGPIPFPSHNTFAGDLNFCLSYFQTANNNPASPFFEKISGKTAVMGHSMGGGCSFLAAGSNANITTVVGFAPAETNPSAIAAAPGVTMPALIFAGSKDAVTPPAGNATAIYNAVTAGCKAYVTITDGSHCRFAESNGLCEFGESTSCLGCSFLPRAQHHALTFQFLNPWLRFYLKGECAQFDVFQNLLGSAPGVTSEQSCGYSLPAASFTASGSLSFCAGGSVDLTANGNYDFSWSTGETSAVISVTESGDYFLVVSDEYDCRDTSATATADVYTSPQPVILSDRNFELCDGETEVLYLNTSYASYLWNDNSTDSSLTTGSAGAYFVQVTDAQGCAGVSDTVHVVVNDLPDAPLVELRNDTLFALPGSGSFQWYDNDFALPGETENFFVPATDGSYWVVVTDKNGCASFSEAFLFTLPVSVFTPENILFQNPANGIYLLHGKPAHIIAYDVFGKQVATTFGNRIDLSPHPAGIYLLRADDATIKVRKL